jgi:multiple antibiotic resistance protein
LPRRAAPVTLAEEAAPLSNSLIESLVTLIVVLDPFGSVPIFLHATHSLGHRDRRRVALIAAAVSLGVLMLFLYLGQYLLEEMHIGIPAFRIGGGIVLFVFALRMILGGHHQGGASEPQRSATEIAVFPVAMPGIASPGALVAVVLLTDNYKYTLFQQTATAGLTVIALALVLIALLLAARIQRWLGSAGIMVITQIMGLILAAFSVQQIIDGALVAFGGGPGH